MSATNDDGGSTSVRSCSCDSAMALSLFPALPDLTGKTRSWHEFEMILNPKPIERSLPEDYCCPITTRLMREPVTTSDGHTYEREAIEKWFETHNTSPLTGAVLESKKLTPVVFVKNAVRKLLDKHPELRDSKEWYLPESWVKELGQACEKGDEAAIRELVGRDRRLLVHIFDDKSVYGGKTALQLAVLSSGQALEVVVELLEKRKRGLALAALLKANAEGHTPLHQAILAPRDWFTVLTIMSWMGKSLHMITAPPDWPLEQSTKEAGSETVMDPHAVQVLDIVNTILLWSVDRGDPVKASCLLRLQANPNVINNHGQHVLYLAVKQQAKLADEKKREEEDTTGQIVRLLLEGGADPNALNQDEEDGPLHLALERNLFATALELEKAGAKPDLKLKNGTTPLHVVASKPTTELADALWNESIPPRQLPSSELEAPSGADGDTPLHCAAKSGSTAMLHWLVNKGAQVTAVNAKRQSILHVAAMHNYTQFAADAVKLADGQALSFPDNDGNTPLHLAVAQASASDMVKWLLVEYGAVTSRNQAGQLPHQVAESLGHWDVVKAYDETMSTLKSKEDALLADQGPLGQLLARQQRVIETQQARLEQQEEEIKAQQAQSKQQEDEILKLRGLEGQILKLKGLEGEILHLRESTAIQMNTLETRVKEQAHEMSRLLAREQEFLQVKGLLKNLMDESAKVTNARTLLEVRSFLKHVARVEHKEVETMIDRNRSILLCKGEVTDLSKRTFKNITGFQYAVWALDWRMWQLMLKYLPKEEAALQYKELTAQGTEYGTQVDWVKLIEAYQTVIHGQSSSQPLNVNSQASYLALMAKEQRLLPVHVLHEYAAPNFHRTDFDQPEFPKEMSFRRWYDDANSNVVWLQPLFGDTLKEMTSLNPGDKLAILLDQKAVTLLLHKRREQRGQLGRDLASYLLEPSGSHTR